MRKIEYKFVLLSFEDESQVERIISFRFEFLSSCWSKIMI